MMNSLSVASYTFAKSFENEAGRLKICFTESDLKKPVPAEDAENVSPFQTQATVGYLQIALRIEDKVYIDNKLYVSDVCLR
jgi:hypothetical protein